MFNCFLQIKTSVKTLYDFIRLGIIHEKYFLLDTSAYLRWEHHLPSLETETETNLLKLGLSLQVQFSSLKNSKNRKLECANTKTAHMFLGHPILFYGSPDILLIFPGKHAPMDREKLVTKLRRLPNWLSTSLLTLALLGILTVFVIFFIAVKFRKQK